MDVKRLAQAEIAAINRTLKEFGVNAGAYPDGRGTLIAHSSHIAHRIKRGTGVQIADVEKRLPELRRALSMVRGMDDLPVRLQVPALVIETPHPKPQALPWRPELLAETPPHSMLVGRSYTGNRQVVDERITFDDSTHVLVTGITKAGKSVLMQMMLLSLAWNTSPQELKIVLVDLKNEDMIPFANLPHVITFAKRPDEAIDAIGKVFDEKEKRIDDPSRKPYRLVLWIDELAQLAQSKDASEMLDSLASIGRSKEINLIAATQYPTKDGGLGMLMKANFPLRLVGMVAPGMAHIATGRPKTGAEQLPGKGAFLYCQSNDVHRFQSYFIDMPDIYEVVGKVRERWGQTAKPVERMSQKRHETGGLTGLPGLNQPQTVQRFVQATPTITEIPYAPPESPQVQLAIRRIYNAVGQNKNQALDMLGWYPGHNKVTALEYLNMAIGD